ARETGDADQGGRRDEQQWVCYHTNSVQGVYDKRPSNRANLPLMQVRIRLAAPLLFTLLVLASSRALNHMDQPLALLLIVPGDVVRSEEHTSELQSRRDLVCRLLLEKKKKGNLSVMCHVCQRVVADKRMTGCPI